MTRKPDELGEQIRAIREEVIMKTLSVMLIAGSVLLLGNMVRNLHLGNPLSIVHPFLYLVALALYLTRRRIGAPTLGRADRGVVGRRGAGAGPALLGGCGDGGDSQ